MRTLQVNQTSSPILEVLEKKQQIHTEFPTETTEIKFHYHNFKKRNSLNQMVNEELNYEIASSRNRLIDEFSQSSLNDNLPVETAESNLDSNSSCKLIESQSTINEMIPKNKPTNTVEFNNDETSFMINKELNVDTYSFTNAIKKACQIEDMIAKNIYHPTNHQGDEIKNIISVIKANSEHLKTMNDDQIFDVIVNHMKLNDQETNNNQDDQDTVNNLHSVKSLKNFFEVRAMTNENDLHLKDEDVKRINSIEKSVNHGLGTCSDLENESKKDIQKEPNMPVAPPLPEFLINREETKPKFSIKARRSKTDSIYFYNQSNDLHDKLIREIHNKSLERSRKDTSLVFDEHGNLINKPLTQKNRTKMSRLKESNSPSTISEKINQLGLSQTKITSFRYNKNRSQSVDSKLNDRTIDMEMSNEIVDRQVQMIEMITGCKSSHRLNDLNQNTTIRSDFSRISNSSVHSSRSMLSEAKAKLEAFGKYSKQPKYESPKNEINADLNLEQNLDSSIQVEACASEFLQTKF